MLVTSFSDRVVSGRVYCDRGVYVVKGKLHLGYHDSKLYYRAPEPQDLRLSVQGSALPFPGPEMAFGPQNSGQATIDRTGNFEFQLFSPNAFYKNDDIMNGVGQGKILVPPHVLISVVCKDGQRKDYKVQVGAHLDLRSLTNFPGKSVRSTGRNTPSYISA